MSCRALSANSRCCANWLLGLYSPQILTKFLLTPIPKFRMHIRKSLSLHDGYCLRVRSTNKRCQRRDVSMVLLIVILLAKETSYSAARFSLSPAGRDYYILCNNNEGLWAYFSEFVDAEQPPLTLPIQLPLTLERTTVATATRFPYGKFVKVHASDMDFALEEHDWDMGKYHARCHPSRRSL